MKFIRVLKASENTELSVDDFDFIQSSDGRWHVRPLNDKANQASLPLYDLTDKDRQRSYRKLLELVRKYNSREIIEKRKKLMSDLNKLFKRNGLEKGSYTTTSVRGFHTIRDNGYYFEKSFEPSAFDIKLTWYNGNEEYSNKIKNILDSKNIKYTEKLGDIHIDLNDQNDMEII